MITAILTEVKCFNVLEEVLSLLLFPTIKSLVARNVKNSISK